jgi:hypothetical protein
MYFIQALLSPCRLSALRVCRLLGLIVAVGDLAPVLSLYLGGRCFFRAAEDPQAAKERWKIELLFARISSLRRLG